MLRFSLEALANHLNQLIALKHKIYSANDYESAIEALSNEAYSIKLSREMQNETAMTESVLKKAKEIYQEHRKFLLKIVKGRQIIERYVLEELQFLVEAIEQQSKKPDDLKGSESPNPVAIGRILGTSASNVMAKLVMGKRFDYDDDVHRVIGQVLGRDDNFDTTDGLFTGYRHNFQKAVAKAVSIFPGLITFDHVNHRMFIEQAMSDFLDAAIDEHILTFDPELEPRDMIDSYFHEFVLDKKAQEKDSVVMSR